MAAPELVLVMLGGKFPGAQLKASGPDQPKTRYDPRLRPARHQPDDHDDDHHDDHDHDDDQKFAPAPPARVTALVANGIAATRDTYIAVPAPSHCWNGHVDLDNGEPESIMVAIAIDGMTLRIHPDATHFELSPAAKVPALPPSSLCAWRKTRAAAWGTPAVSFTCVMGSGQGL